MGINLSSLLGDDELLLCKRISELHSRAENSILSVSQFLNSRERYIIENRFAHIFSSEEDAPLCFFWGGYPDAERVLLCCLPAYVRYSLSGDEIPTEFVSEHILPLRIKSGGYVKLSHRDYLGAIIALGIERTSIGDILPDDEGAVIFVSPSVAGLIKNELVYIGRDKVKVADANLPAGFNYERAYQQLHSTVASPRLDAVLSELARTSRENAKDLILSGLVEHNHFPASKPDSAVEKGDTISLRKSNGVKGGKFIIDSLDEKLKSGRIRLLARKYL